MSTANAPPYGLWSLVVNNALVFIICVKEREAAQRFGAEWESCAPRSAPSWGSSGPAQRDT